MIDSNKRSNSSGPSMGQRSRALERRLGSENNSTSSCIASSAAGDIFSSGSSFWLILPTSRAGVNGLCPFFFSQTSSGRFTSIHAAQVTLVTKSSRNWRRAIANPLSHEQRLANVPFADEADIARRYLDVSFGPIPDIPSDCNGTVSSTTILMSEFSDRYLWY
jgi:hypothetical protein